MKMEWLKLHHDVISDQKMRRFSPQEKWAWVVLLVLASQSRTRGTIEGDNDDIADYCEFNTTQDWLYYRDKLIAKGMLEINADGNLHLCNWEERQSVRPSDRPEAVKARVRKHRDKKKQPVETTCNALQAPCNAFETTSNEQIRLDQIREEKTRSDLEKEEINPIQHAYACSAPELEDLGKSFPQPEPSKSSETVRPVDNQGVDTSQGTVAKDMGSAAVLKVAKSQIDYERFRETYNAERPPLWAELQVVNDKRQKVFKQLVKDCGGQDNAIAALVNALTFARSDGWWNTKTLSFENFATNGKILQLHERQTTLQASGLPNITPSIQKSLQVRSQVARALDRFRTQEAGQ